jgi:hypothetical protein
VQRRDDAGDLGRALLDDGEERAVERLALVDEPLLEVRVAPLPCPTASSVTAR